MRRGLGFTLIELLVAMGVLAILIIALAMAVSAASRSRRLQKAISELEQDTAVAIQLLQAEIARASYRGDLEDAFQCFDLRSGSSQCQWQDDEKAQALSWIAKHWDKLQANGNALETLSVTDDAANGDTLVIRSLAPAVKNSKKYPPIYKDSNGWPYLHYGVQEISFKLLNHTLKRERDTYLCPDSGGVDITQDPASTVQCTKTSNGDAQPVISIKVEDFQVFFLKRDGTWQKDRPPANDTAAVGIYLRTAYPSPVSAKKCSWPSSEAKNRLPESSTDLGIQSVGYTGDECKYPRLERVLTVYLGNQQVW